MSITKQWRVSVRMDPAGPNDDFDTNMSTITDSQAYARDVCHATHGSEEAGSVHYCEVFEWAVFDNEKDAIRCERELTEIAKKLHLQLKRLAAERALEDAQDVSEPEIP